ncbi:putative secreted protein (Por secretion system target), partial [Christiangramia gaetbulicola]
NGCTATTSADIEVPLAFSASATPTDVSCNDDDGNAADGAIAVDVTNGVAPLTYSWTGPGGYTASTEDLSGLSAAGTYNLTITDGNGCTATTSADIEVPLAFSASATPTDVSCNDDDGNAADGAIAVEITNGVAPLTYSWTGPGGYTASTEDLSGLSAAGTYNLTITDGNGCTATTSADIEVPDQLKVNLDKSFDPKCVAAKDGSIEVTASGGTGPYDMVLSSLGTTVESKDNVVSKYTFNNLGEGFYKVVVTDENGCTTEKDLIQISDPLPILGTPTPGDETCFLADGTISLSVSGGSGGYTYSWTKQGDATFSSTSKDLSGLSAGTYDCEIKDSNGCIGLVSDVVINSPINCDHIFPTQTDCQDYSENIDDLSAIVLDAVCLTKGGNLVSNATPGVFFYFGDWIATSTGKVTINIVQTRDNLSVLSPFLVVNSSNVKVQTFDSCNDIKKGTRVTIETDKGSPTGNVSVTFNAVANERYVISVKYDVKSILDKTYGESTYTFGMTIGGNPISGSFGQISAIDCNASPAAAITSETTALKSSITVEEPSFSVAPVPFKDQVTVRYDFEYTSDVKIQFFDLNGSLLRTYTDKQVSNGDETQINIDFALRSNSVYIMRIETDRDSFSKNVMSGN